MEHARTYFRTIVSQNYSLFEIKFHFKFCHDGCYIYLDEDQGYLHFSKLCIFLMQFYILHKTHH